MPRILHFGIGNFHRAHQARYTHSANMLAEAAGQASWRITGVSLNRPDMRNALAPQNFEYTLVTKSADGARYQRMNVHDDILVASENSEGILALIEDSETRIITLTVTEKGYCLNEAGSGLNLSSGLVEAELSDGQPRTTIGFLSHGLARRLAAGGEPLTIISCDNLSENGHLLRRAVYDFSEAADLNLSEYLDDAVTFPRTMVDQIVPATTDSLRQEVLTETGFDDASPVASETFSEWIIEDDFATDRPLWEQSGARIINDVSPYELRKLRLLNGAHSLLAYGGLLAGHRYVHEAVADRDLPRAALALMEEAQQTLPQNIQSGTGQYISDLFKRFENPALEHELAQIAMDGSAKLPVRIVPTLKEKTGDSAALLPLAFWVAFVYRSLSEGAAVSDPAAEQFALFFVESDTVKDFATRMLRLVGVDAVPAGFEAKLDDLVS
jgi:fructuronate reductase